MLGPVLNQHVYMSSPWDGVLHQVIANDNKLYIHINPTDPINLQDLNPTDPINLQDLNIQADRVDTLGNPF